MPGKARGSRRVVASGSGTGGAEDPPVRSPRRNSQKDRDFIKDNRFNFRVVDGYLVYTGDPLDFGHPFQLPPDEYRCTYETPIRDDEGKPILDPELNALGRRCPAWGLRISYGRTLHLCMDHVPRGAAGVQAAVKGLMLNASLAITAATINDALDPETAVKDRTAIMREVLDRIGVRGGVEISADVKGWKAVLDKMMGEEDGEPDAPLEE